MRKRRIVPVLIDAGRHAMSALERDFIGKY